MSEFNPEKEIVEPSSLEIEGGFALGEIPRIEALGEHIGDAIADANKALGVKYADSPYMQEYLGIGA